MKRSHLNAIIAEAEESFRKVGFHLPAFGHWGREEWRARQAETLAMRVAGLGWDVTDFGEDRFEAKGLLLFTMRNGVLGSGDPGNRPYAEKIMISGADQLTPMHRHAQKVEDIIHRAPLSAGARLAIKLNAMHGDGALDEESDVVAYLDGRTQTVAAGGVVLLSPGESITLFPGTYHAFWGDGGGVVVGEVSSVNDDLTDNFFAEPLARFSTIEEDADPYRLLVTDYPRLPSSEPTGETGPSSSDYAVLRASS